MRLWGAFGSTDALFARPKSATGLPWQPGHVAGLRLPDVAGAEGRDDGDAKWVGGPALPTERVVPGRLRADNGGRFAGRDARRRVQVRLVHADHLVAFF